MIKHLAGESTHFFRWFVDGWPIANAVTNSTDWEREAHAFLSLDFERLVRLPWKRYNGRLWNTFKWMNVNEIDIPLEFPFFWCDASYLELFKDQVLHPILFSILWTWLLTIEKRPDEVLHSHSSSRTIERKLFIDKRAIDLIGHIILYRVGSIKTSCGSWPMNVSRSRIDP